MDFATQHLAKELGPLGGNLHNPAQRPEFRTSPLNAKPSSVAGMPGLHRYEDTANHGLKNEQAWHRMAAFMLLAGRTNSEIGAAAGVVPETVSHLRAQRWFQELLAVLANEQGQDILGLLQSEAAASVEKLVSLRDGAESERVQLAAASTLLEHAKGKAVQQIVSHTSHSKYSSPDEEMNAIMAELSVLRQTKTIDVPASKETIEP